MLDWIKQGVSDVDISLFMAVNSLVGRSAAFDYCIQIMDVWHLLLYGWMPVYLWMLWFDPKVADSRAKIVSGLIGARHRFANPGLQRQHQPRDRYGLRHIYAGPA